MQSDLLVRLSNRHHLFSISHAVTVYYQQEVGSLPINRAGKGMLSSIFCSDDRNTCGNVTYYGKLYHVDVIRFKRQILRIFTSESTIAMHEVC